MAAYARRQFAGGAISTTVPLGMGSSDASFTLATGGSTNWPDGSTGNFTVVIDTATPEKILCSARSGLVVTVASSGRGYDGTSAVAHPTNSAIQCVHIAQDDDEANQVVSAVLGQPSAAKGDILYMLSAAGPNTLARLPLGTTRQVMTPSGTGIPSWAAPFLLVPIAKSISYAAVNNDLVIPSANITVTTPAAAATAVFGVAPQSSAVTTVTAATGVIFGPGCTNAGAASIVVASNSYVVLESDGTNWNIVAGQQDSGWNLIANGSMSNSWVNGSPVFAYRLVGDVVELRGQVVGGTANATAFTLPAGFRPLQAFGTATSGAAASLVNITSAGVVTFSASAPAFLYLDNIHFRV